MENLTTDCHNPIEFGTGQFSGTYYKNERYNKIQLDIDTIDWDLVEIQKRFNTIEEMKTFLSSEYNFTLLITSIRKSGF